MLLNYKNQAIKYCCSRSKSGTCTQLMMDAEDAPKVQKTYHMSTVLITSKRYCHLRSIPKNILTSDSNISLYVKKKLGHLTYMQDLHSFRPPHLLQICNGGGGGGSAGATMADLTLIGRFVSNNTTEDSNDHHLQDFSEYLCIAPAQESVIQTTTNTIIGNTVATALSSVQKRTNNDTNVITMNATMASTVTTTMEKFCSKTWYNTLYRRKTMLYCSTIVILCGIVHQAEVPLGQLLRWFYATTAITTANTTTHNCCSIQQLRIEEVDFSDENEEKGGSDGGLEKVLFEILSYKFVATLCVSVDRMFMMLVFDGSTTLSSYSTTTAEGGLVGLYMWRESQYVCVWKR